MLSGPSGLPQPEPLASAKMTSVSSFPSGIAKGLRPLTHGTSRETHIQKKTNIDPQEMEAQPLNDAVHIIPVVVCVGTIELSSAGGQ